MADRAQPMEPLLDVRGLQIAFQTRGGLLPITHDVSFCVRAGERVGLVGESGCGKSVTGLSLMRLLPSDAARISGQVLLQGRDLLRLPEPEMRAVRGREMAMIFQEPMSALDPVFSIGEQIAETFRTHFPSRTHEAPERTMEVLDQVGIPAPRQRYHEYPHQLSGGMRQRVMIAMALICEPKLLIADEPTTALDVTVQAQILDLLRELSDRNGTAIILITHDLGVVAEICTRMLTMYAGEVVEDAGVEEALMSPRHPYTSGLLRSLPRMSARHEPLAFIPGRVPLPGTMPASCRFMARCSYAAPPCEAVQLLRPIDGRSRNVRCALAHELNLPGVGVHG